MGWYITVEIVNKAGKVIYSVDVPVWMILLAIMVWFCIIRILTFKTT